MGYTINPFTLAGCTEPAIAVFQFDVLFYVLAAVYIFYGVCLFCCPFNLINADSVLKYSIMSWDCAFKPDFRHEWDVLSSVNSHFCGTLFIFIGMFFLWATEARDDFTFFTVLTIGWAFALATWLFVLLKFKSEWKPIVYTWGVSFTVALILSIVVLVQQDSDIKQLSDGAEDDGVNPGTILWVLTVLQGLSTLQLVAASLFPSVEQLIGDMHLKEGFEPAAHKTLHIRFSAVASVAVFMIIFWAAYNRQENDSESKYTFLLVAFLTTVLGLALISIENNLPSMADAFANHTQTVATFIFTSLSTATFIAWLMACEVEV